MVEGKKEVVCDECKKEVYKYKCPGCSIRSCSLPCVKSHKLRTGCTGKRHTEYLPISQFTHNTLLSDYTMLEEVKRVAESAQRTRAKLGGPSSQWLPRHLQCLRKAAGSRCTNLAFLSNGMSKRVTNRSYYNARKKIISWTIEWRFHSTKVALFDHGINENQNLCSVIENHLRPGPWTHPLRQFSEQPLDSLRFFIRKYSKGPKSPFRELDIKSPIRQQLANLFILEYPVIHVFLPSHSFDFEIVKDITEQKSVIKEEPVADDPPSPKGVIFKEEEIEETNSSAPPQVFDLFENPNPNYVLESSISDRSLLEENSAQGSKPTLEGFGNALDNDVMQSIDFDIDDIDLPEDFDFEQGLLAAYTDLMANHNPDDFLDLDGLLSEDASNFQDVEKKEEELEEGEIPDL